MMKPTSVSTPQQHADYARSRPPVSPALRRRPGRRRATGQLILHFVLIIAALVAVGPLIWGIFASFKPFKELMTSQTLLPSRWTLDSYRAVFGLSNLWSGFRNSLIVTAIVTSVSVFTSTCAGFVFAKYRFWGKEFLFLLLLATLMVPFMVILIPLYLTVSRMGFANQLSGVIVTGFFSTFGIFMMRQFMSSIPYELLEAARMDGASEWRTFVQIVIPLSASPMAALGIFIFLGTWNDYLWPLVVLTSSDQQTLPLVLAGLQGYYQTQYDYLIAAAILTTIPLMTAYIFGSKYMIRGIAMTGLKF
ncbi:MAG: putative transporter permease protein [Chloroflexi bacterium]|nr:putative transporter permease protein [Chloroflexota bacterium]